MSKITLTRFPDPPDNYDPRSFAELIRMLEQLMRIARIIPDFRDQSGDLDITWSFKNYPYGNVVSQTALTVATTDTKKDMRGRGRQANFKITSNESGGNFKMGTFIMDIYPDGGR